MTFKRLFLTGLFVVVACIVTSRGDADARYRWRDGWAPGGSWGWRQNSYGYGNNRGGTYYGYQNVHTYPSVAGSVSNPGNIKASAVQANGTQSVGKPVLVNTAAPVTPTYVPAVGSWHPVSQAPGIDPTAPEIGGPYTDPTPQQGGITDYASGM